MDPILTSVITLVGVVVASFFTYRASTRKQRSDAGQQMIDQHQEQIVEMRAEIRLLQRQIRVQGDYIGLLRLHIADNHPPPPPPWPPGLIT